MENPDTIHWADEKEAIKTNRPLKIILLLLKHLPGWLVRTVIYPVSFFYYIFSPRARNESYRYQKQLKKFTNGECPKKIRAYRQILSFALCVLEKMQGWLGQIEYSTVEYQNDDITPLINQLKEKKGALLIASHHGNIELMRSLSGYCSKLVGFEVPIIVVMEVATTEQFTKTLKEINGEVSHNVINSADIGPDTIVYLMEQIEKGGLVIIAGDRTSAHARDKIIVQDFLGKPAPFPYGTFLIPFLLKCPIYYMFGLRSKTSIFYPKQRLYLEKSLINTDCSREEREDNIKALCAEFSGKLEKYTKMYPYQWYNFHNFWNL